MGALKMQITKSRVRLSYGILGVCAQRLLIQYERINRDLSVRAPDNLNCIWIALQLSACPLLTVL
jgi:hypothetical protein